MTTQESGYPGYRSAGLFAGPLVLLLFVLTPPAGELSVEAWRTAGMALFMAVWWITEPVPIPVTSLLPLVLFPLLGILNIGDTAGPYANPTIFLFMGGFVIALAMQRHNLHRRVALGVVLLAGATPARLVLGVMLATAFISMWVSNSATAVMMLPIGLSLVQLSGVDTDGHPVDTGFALSLMLGIAYASSIGGLGTLVGTPPNALLAAFMLETYGVEVGFVQWMIVGVPLVLVALPIAWLLLVRLHPVGAAEIAGGRDTLRRERERLGPVTAQERAVALIFTATALLWMTQPLVSRVVPGLSDTVIAIGGAVATFLVPVRLRAGEFLMDWRSAEKLPWGVLLLFGGGLALAEAVTSTGLADAIGTALNAMGAWPIVLVVIVVALVVIFFTELASNTATAAAFLPLVAALAVGIGENPFLLVVPAVLAASSGFMMPVGTPPNAIVYSSGYVTMPQMARAGVLLNLLFVALITAAAYTLVVLAFGVEPGVVPDWARTAVSAAR